jgi:hypothetical protein
MSAAELRACAERVFKLPIQNDETAHADKDELVWTLNLLADTWPTNASQSSGDMRAIETGRRFIKTRKGVSTVLVERRTRRAKAA